MFWNTSEEWSRARMGTRHQLTNALSNLEFWCAERSRDAFAALDAKLSEFVGTNDEKLAALWRAAQYGGVDL